MTRRSPRIEPTLADTDRPQDIPPDAAVVLAEKTEVAADLQPATTDETPPAAATPKAPTGKLADVIEHISGSEGATIDDLIAATGWQPQHHPRRTQPPAPARAHDHAGDRHRWSQGLPARAEGGVTMLLETSTPVDLQMPAGSIDGVRARGRASTPPAQDEKAARPQDGASRSAQRPGLAGARRPDRRVAAAVPGQSTAIVSAATSSNLASPGSCRRRRSAGSRRPSPASCVISPRHSPPPAISAAPR